LDSGDYDAIILAAAGLKRLQMGQRISELIAPPVMLPAIAQGAIGVECRIDDPTINALLKPLNHTDTQIRVSAERALNARLQGGCQVPIGGYAELEQGVIVLRGLVGRPDGSEVVNGVISGRPDDAEEIGVVLAEDLLSRGAKEILQELFAAHE
jgi:hydroxymethylbilane synthase